jgi:NAD(P)H dehydrogenase (quinone)
METVLFMKISIVLAHPDPASFNAAIGKVVRETLMKDGHVVAYHDLYAEQFDPLLQRDEIPKEAQLDPVLRRHCEEIAHAEGIVVVHPNWWGQPPAILKGWVDRVLRPGTAYEFLEGDGGEGVPQGLLRAHTALVFNTSNTAPEREVAVFGDPLERIWKDCIFGLCGVSRFYRQTFGIMVLSTPAQRTSWLQAVTDTVRYYFPSVPMSSQ